MAAEGYPPRGRPEENALALVDVKLQVHRHVAGTQEGGRDPPAGAQLGERLRHEQPVGLGDLPAGVAGEFEKGSDVVGDVSRAPAG